MKAASAALGMGMLAGLMLSHTDVWSAAIAIGFLGIGLSIIFQVIDTEMQ